MHFSQIADQVDSWLDSINEIVEFSKQNLDVVCETIKMQEPGKKLLSEKKQKVYHEKIQDYLRGKMRNGKIYNRHELKILCVRFLLEKTNPNSDFDILFFLKVKAVGQIYRKLHTYLLLGKFYCCTL